MVDLRVLGFNVAFEDLEKGFLKDVRRKRRRSKSLIRREGKRRLHYRAHDKWLRRVGRKAGS